MSELNIGIFGGGTVGGGVVELINRNIRSGRWAQLGLSITVKKICVKSVNKQRDFSTGGIVVVSDVNDILEDDSINCVIELIGGITTAKDIVFEAIARGKHVVTANKALIATFLPAIQALLDSNPSVKFCYEAAVCGGIPIINALHGDFIADRITKIMGIMNGTTNFMLCKMEDEGADYSAALSEAQALGYAEADPTADVEGLDVQAKIAILAKLSFGVAVPVEAIPTVGISSLEKVDFKFARSVQSSIKLLGTAAVNDDGSLCVYVTPTLVPLSSPFATAKGPGNMVVVSSDSLRQSTLAGPGAGRYPTANSVLNDLVRLANGTTARPFPLSSSAELSADYESRFYVRIRVAEGDASEAVLAAAADHGIQLSLGTLGGYVSAVHEVGYLGTTDKVRLSQMRRFVEALSALPTIGSVPVMMPLSE